jgi:2-polyprenyl-3-methyl-5-hydroxy-6-metoxy-1,4-benzoquinol methylase
MSIRQVMQMHARMHLNAFRRRFPATYCRVRNGVALAAWYANRLEERYSRGSGADAYGTAFWDFHDSGDWEAFAGLVLRHFPATSVVDIGCGQGLALHGFARVKPALTLRGFDSSATALERARARGLVVDPIDVVTLSAREIAALVTQIGQIDLARCLELAEHLPSWHSGKLLDLLMCGRKLIFSAAHPNQGGRLHVNERHASYWIERLGRRGFQIAPSDAGFRQELANLSLPPWYAQNARAFERHVS